MKKLFFAATISTITAIAGNFGRKRRDSIIAHIKTKKEKREKSKSDKQLQKLYKLAFPRATDSLSDVNDPVDTAANRLLHILVKKNVSTIHIAKCLTLGADINTKNGYGEPPVFLAKNLNMIRFLKEKGADLSLTDLQDNTLLHVVAQWQNIDHETGKNIISFLTTHNPEDPDKTLLVDSQNKKGETPLHIASYYQTMALCLLEEEYPEINSANKNGETPLFYLVRSPYKTELDRYRLLEKFIADYHADVLIRNTKKEMAIAHVPDEDIDIKALLESCKPKQSDAKRRYSFILHPKDPPSFSLD